MRDDGLKWFIDVVTQAFESMVFFERENGGKKVGDFIVFT